VVVTFTAQQISTAASIRVRFLIDPGEFRADRINAQPVGGMKFRLTIVDTPCNLNAAQFCRGSGGRFLKSLIQFHRSAVEIKGEIKDVNCWLFPVIN
jgi:hypothetical protein